MKLIAFIPAREGSKRIPKKNFNYFAGKPLISWAIEAAMKIDAFDNIIVSSDYADAAEIVAHYRESDTRVEFCYRIKEFALDWSNDWQWIKYTLDQIGWNSFTHYAILRPTNPFRSSETINRAIEEYKAFEDSEKISLKSIQPVKEYPGKMWIDCENPKTFIPYEHMLVHSKPASFEEQSSNFKTIYIQNGCIDICPVAIIKRWQNRYIGNKIYPFFTRALEGFDLNTIDDWEYAEYIVKFRCNGEI